MDGNKGNARDRSGEIERQRKAEKQRQRLRERNIETEI